jgi:hypothetical protein
MKALLVTAAVALSSALATTGAHADPPPPLAGDDQAISVKGGYAEFQHYGEILEVSDGVLDGRGVRAYLGGVGSSKVPDYQLSDYQANGDPVRMNLSLPERQRVVLRVCYTVDHERDQCSEWQPAVT